MFSLPAWSTSHSFTRQAPAAGALRSSICSPVARAVAVHPRLAAFDSGQSWYSAPLIGEPALDGFSHAMENEFCATQPGSIAVSCSGGSGARLST